MEMEKEMQELLDKAMPDIARRVQNELILKCPVDTGRLRNSIKVYAQKDGLLIWMANYGKYVEFGTPPHTIEAKNKKALKFEWTEIQGKMEGKKGRLNKGMTKAQSKNVFFKKVKHPGTRPNPFVRTMITNKLRDIIMEELQKAQLT